MFNLNYIAEISNVIYEYLSKHKYEAIVGIAFALVSSALYHKKKASTGGNSVKKKSTKFKLRDEDILEVLFFSDKNAVCVDHINDQETCDEDCGFQKLNKLVEYIDSATTSLDVCVYTITSYKLAEAILRKFHQGVIVRVITDESMSYGDGSQISVLRKNGVRVRVKVSSNLMHHKFAIVDKRVLINGSFNWTQQATFGNWENVIITSVPESLVTAYCDQFDELWKILY